MKTTSAQLFGAVAGSVLLASAGAAVAVPVVNATMDDGAVAYAAAVDQAAATDAQSAVAKVQGDFSFTQAKVTSLSDIAEVFSKAAATLCTDMPDYGVSAASESMTITGGTTMQATVSDLQADEAAESVLMACACASNVAGGGAMANAEASGVSLATVAAMVQAL